MTRAFGLIGKKLTHSFSGTYFNKKFQEEGITDCSYQLFEIDQIDELPRLIQNRGLAGLNVTIPYKQEVLKFMDEVDESADKIGAINVIKVHDQNQLTGYNSDYYGFRRSLENWLAGDHTHIKALVLGTGGASKAVAVVLNDLDIVYNLVSRTKGKSSMTYSELTGEFIADHNLIINTTPLGTFPDVLIKPDLPYEGLTHSHYMYDLVYNPPETAFMKAGVLRGARVKNGLEMLHLQAEKSWEIWNS